MIYFKSSDIAINSDKDKTILEHAEEHEIHIRNLCRKGICGSCKVLLEDGHVRSSLSNALHKNESDEGYILACISKPSANESDLRIDESKQPVYWENED